jgi:ABC-2 type transport system permease protein
VNVLTVARKELTALGRSPLVWALAALIGLIAAPGIVRLPSTFVGADTPDRMAVLMLASFAERPIAFAAILVGSLAVAGERETGSLRVLSGFPLPRRDLLLGKVAGRGLVLLATVVAGQLLIVTAVLYRLDGVSASAIAFGIGLTALFALAHFGIGVGVSAVAGTRLGALAASLGLYIFFRNYWEGVVVRPVFGLLTGRSPIDAELRFTIVTHLGTGTYLQLLNPNNAFSGAITFDAGVDWFSIAVLAGWFVVPVTVGYVRFRGRDLDGSRWRPLAPVRRRLGGVSLPRPSLPTPGFLDRPSLRHPVLTYARADLRSLRRSWLIVGLLVALVGQFVAAALGVPVGGPEADGVTPLPGVGTHFGPLFSEFGAGLLVPVVTILLGALVVVDEVETGRYRAVASYPVARRDVLVGKVLGRGLLFVGAMVTGLLAAVAVLWVRPTTVDLGTVALGGGATIGRGLAFFGIAVGASAFARRRITALGGSFAAVVLFTSAWRTLAVGVPYLLARGSFPSASDLAYAAGSPPEWFHYLLWANPTESFVALGWVSGPIQWLFVAVLVCWTVVPAAVGYRRFRSRDIA